MKCKRLKANYIKGLFNRISKALNLKAELLMSEDAENYPDHIKKYISNCNVYGFHFHIAGTSYIFINTNLIYENFKRFGPKAFKDKNMEYVPMTLKLAYARVIIHEFTHRQIDIKRQINNKNVLNNTFEKLLVALDKHNMANEMFMFENEKSQEDRVHDSNFYNEFYANLFKSYKIIMELEREM